MLTEYGHQLFLDALKGVKGFVRFHVGGARLDGSFPVDAGYPKVADTDEANDGRGSSVLTWRVTVPKGSPWGPTGATEADITDAQGRTIYRAKLPVPFHVSASHPSVLYINFFFRRA